MKQNKFSLKNLVVIFFLLVLPFVLIGITSCDKEDMHLSSSKGVGVINGEDYKYKSGILDQIMAPTPYNAYIYKQNNIFIFQTGEMGFLPANKKSNSPNFLISFTLSEAQDFVIGKKYDIKDNDGSNEDYMTDCYFHRYWWADGVSYDELRRYATGNVEFTRIDKENGWIEGVFEFEVPATDGYEKWTAKGNFKLSFGR